MLSDLSRHRLLERTGGRRIELRGSRMNADDVNSQARRLAHELQPGDLQATLSGITGAAVRTLPDVQEASISILHSDGRLETVAPTSPVVTQLDEAQEQLREGPCLEASAHGVHVVSPDLRTDRRFPRYARVAEDLGFVAQAGFNLFVREDSRGALNLYSQQPGAFTDIAEVAPLFAEQAALALGYAAEIDNLNRALETRTLIGQAVGIVMERYQLEERAAFAFLTRLSQQHNVKLRDVAREINATVSATTDDPAG
jgi:ANTAR domain/GAF domain